MEKQNVNENLILIDDHTRTINRLYNEKNLLLDEMSYQAGGNASKGKQFGQGLTKYSVSGNIFVPIGETIPSGPFRAAANSVGVANLKSFVASLPSFAPLALPSPNVLLTDPENFPDPEPVVPSQGVDVQSGLEELPAAIHSV